VQLGAPAAVAGRERDELPPQLQRIERGDEMWLPGKIKCHQFRNFDHVSAGHSRINRFRNS
jgi:hypothetical protein